MKKRICKFLTVMMAMIVAFTTICPTTIYASQPKYTEKESVSDNSISENSVLEKEEDLFGEEGKLNYLYLENNYIETPSTQRVLISFGDENTNITKATLVVENYNTKEKNYYSSEDCMDNLVLFEMEMTADEAGIYEVYAVSVTTDDGKTKYVVLSKTGMENVYYGVDTEVVLTESVNEVLPEETAAVVETQIVTFDEGEVEETTDEDIVEAVEEALDKADKNVADDTLDLEVPLSVVGAVNMGTVGNIPATTSAGNLVVVIDPGHDNTHAGARANGLEEEDLTLKIAQYCKQELEQYAGVTVYMTRSDSGVCPYPGSSSTTCNKGRVDYAKSVGADVYVSIHLNSASSASANGAEVYYPNSSYNASVGQEGANLANKIQRQLTALGLTNRGIAIRNSGDNTLYPDGSIADYYGVIKNSKLAGFPAVIVEHAFLTNASDAAFLSQEANLQKLGVADATGIAEYYGLDEAYDFSANPITFTNVNHTNGTFTASFANLEPAVSVKLVEVAVWSKADRSDLKWYTAQKVGNAYQINVNVANHNKNSGTYQAHVYVTAVNNKSYYLQAGNVTLTPPAMKASNFKTTINPNGIATITADGQGFNALEVAVWSVTGGQDDLKWYQATKNANGQWQVNVPLTAHKTAGTYNVHAYGTNAYGSKIAGTSTFVYSGPRADAVVASDVNSGAGTFKVTVDNVRSTAAISKVEVAVWSQSNQSDLKWYTATKDANGDFTFNVNIANHGYNYGTYNLHAYATDALGINACVKTGKTTINLPKAVVTAVGNGAQTQSALKASNVGLAGGVQKVEFAVWSVAGGQDDLKWYDGQNAGNGVWTSNAIIANHKTAGVYNVHAYATNKAGRSQFIGSTTFVVKGPETEKIEITNINNVNGTFTVKAVGVKSAAKIDAVEVAIWSKPDQSDLRWYTAAASGNNTYTVNADIANHDYNYGIYNIHVYATDAAGIGGYQKSTRMTLSQPKAVITAAGNGAQTQYALKASNVGLAGGVQKVEFAVWSTTGGQDDLEWYSAQNAGNGVWTANALISNHKTAGTYSVHAYATNKAGKSQFIGSTTFVVKGPGVQSATISNVNHATGTFTVTATGVTSAAKIDLVEMAVWSKPDQSDMKWYTAKLSGTNTYTINADIANHNYNYGTYNVHVYATDAAGIRGFIAARKTTLSVPKSVITVTGNANQTQYALKASNVGMAGGVQKVEFAVWSATGGQDDLKWYDGQNAGNGTWTTNALISNHRTAGTYNVHIYATNKAGKSQIIGTKTFVVTGPKASAVQAVNVKESDGLFSVKISGISSPSGVSNVEVGIWCASNQSDLVWYDATKQSDGSYIVTADVRNHKNNTGKYQAHVYITTGNGINGFAGSTTCSMINVSNILHPITGSSSVTVEQMMAYYNSVTTYPAFYANSDAPTLRSFCQMYLDECNAEGIKAEVAFVQAMKETNFLRFGGDVSISQYNFAGIGATGGVPGNSFATVRIGIRAQVQHLKAYANNESLNQACVDPRFKYVARNTAPYCEWLGIKENPYGKGWATAVNYGYDIVTRMNRLKSY